MNSRTPPCSVQNVKVVVLVGPCDFGRCPLGSRLNRAYWPVFEKPAIERTIDLLADQGLRRFTVCRQSEPSDLAPPLPLQLPGGAEVTFLNDPLPRGPAGCLRDAIDFVRDDLLLVMPAEPGQSARCADAAGSSIAGPKDSLSVFLNPKTDSAEYPMESGIYLCSPEAVRMIPPKAATWI
jgi:hypothetical protein